MEGRGLGKQYEETGAIDAVRSSDEKGLKGYCFLDAAASSMYMTMDSSAATAPPANQPSAPSFQVRSSENPTIRPIIPQTNAPNAPNLPSQIVHWSFAATPSFDGLRIHRNRIRPPKNTDRLKVGCSRAVNAQALRIGVKVKTRVFGSVT